MDVDHADLLAVVQERRATEAEQEDGGRLGDAVDVVDLGRCREARRVPRLIVVREDERRPAVRAELSLSMVDDVVEGFAPTTGK